jgi:hypothetical protein
VLMVWWQVADHHGLHVTHAHRLQVEFVESAGCESLLSGAAWRCSPWFECVLVHHVVPTVHMTDSTDSSAGLRHE